MPFGMNPADFILDLANGDVSACDVVAQGDTAAAANPAPDDVVARLTKACVAQGGRRVDDDGAVAMETNETRDVDAARYSHHEVPPTVIEPTYATPTSIPTTTTRTAVGEMYTSREHVRPGYLNPKPQPVLPPRPRVVHRRRRRCRPAAPRPLPPPRWACPWHEQTALLLRRSLATRRGQLLDTLKLTQVLVVALIVGALWWDRASQSGVQAVADTSGLLFFELLFLSFLTLFGSLFTFPDERAIAVKERQSGMYRVSAYFCARCLADVPLDLFVPCIFIPIVYWMGGLRDTVEAFFSHAAAVMLLVLVASSMVCMCGGLRAHSFDVGRANQTNV